MNNIIKRTLTSIFLIFLLGIAWVMPLIMGLLLLINLNYILLVEWPLLVQKNRWLWLLTPFYIVIPFLLFFVFNFSAKRNLLFAFIALVASFDIGSYIFGTLLGKNLLCSNISPKKTVEGAAGGLLFAYAIAFILSYAPFFRSFSPIFNYFTVFLICLLALCGDLFESWLKRKAHLKDSGHLLPGHGGLLDRFDSYLWAVYILFLFL